MVLLVCSSGGHLAQLYSLKPWWERFDRVWVSFETSDATSLLSGERVNLLRNLRLAWRTVNRLRPAIVVSTGAGVAVPFFLVAKLRGAKTAYIEVFDRIDSATLTGRLCYPLSDVFALQWPEQRQIYRKGVVIGPLL